MSVGEDFITKAILTERVAGEIERINQQLESFEKIKNYVLLRDRFSEENGMLTPTQKTKGAAITTFYGSHIEKMYDENRVV